MAKKTIIIPPVNKLTQIEQKRVRDFLNGEVKGYAQYVLATRALPNIMDGLRTGARKILYASMTGDLNKKSLVKMPSVIGDVMKLKYHHGDASLYNTVVQLAAKHVAKINTMSIIGQTGVLRNPKTKTAARYLHAEKNPNIELFRVDSELWNIQIDEGEKIEPDFYLPIIPYTLMYRTNSPGFGISFRCMSYSLDSIIDNCIQAINFGTCNGLFHNPLIPDMEGIKPENLTFNANKNHWYSIGEYTISGDTLIVTDLPYNITFDTYEKYLHELTDKNIIASFQNVGLKGAIRYAIKFHTNRLAALYNDKWKFYKMMKLYSQIPADIINVIDENEVGIIQFETAYDFIDAFVKKRLKYYQKRKVNTIDVITKLITKLNQEISFISLVIDGKIIIHKRSVADIKLDLDKFSIPHEVLRMALSRFTGDEINKLMTEIEKQEAMLEYIKITPIEVMYTNELVDLKRSHSTIHQITTK